MLKEKRFLIPIIALYAVLITVLIVTAVYPKLDYDVSRALTSGGAVTYTIGNVLEIWAEPVTLLPMCFIITLAAVFSIKTKRENAFPLPRILGVGLGFGAVVLMYEVIHRIVKYYCKLEDITQPWLVKDGPFASSLLWVKAICAAAALLIIFGFTLIAHKIPYEALKKCIKVIMLCVTCLLLEIAIIEGMKLIFGRMRFREWMQTDLPESPWYRVNGAPESDAYKSFPSGHTANSFLLTTTTFFFDAFGKKAAGNIARICHLCWMIVVMTSRIMAGAHYLSDVAAGMMISLTIVTVCICVMFRKREPKTAR